MDLAAMLSDNCLELSREVFRESRDALFLFDPLSLKILGANPAATATSGRDPDELRSMSVRDLFRFDGAGDPLEFAIPREGSIILDRPARLQSNGRPALPVRLKITRIGGRTGAFGLLTAWTVPEPREPLHMMERFFRMSPDLFCIVDCRGTFVKLNPIWEETLGYPVSELKGRSYFDWLHPEDIEPTRAACLTLEREGELRGFENRLRHRDGHYLRMSWNAVAQDGLHYAAARDVTEEHLRRTDLVRAKEEAEVANRAKSQFFANVSHEIRTPMTAILALTDVLINDPYFREAPAGRFENLVAVKSSGQHLMEVLDDILDLSKIEIGKLSVGIEAYSPIDLVEETISLMKIRANAKGLPLIAEYSSACPSSIQTDPTRLRQVLINLVSNAIKYTERGEIRIKVAPVETGTRERSSLLRFEVADTGIGIAPEMRARLFEPFERADPTAKTMPAGTGLGLSISRRLMELLGGSIELKSDLGKGSTFSITVDSGSTACDDRVQPDRSPSEHRDSREIDAFPTNVLDCRILLVEDSPTNQKAIGMCLQIAGASVVTASNGASAIDEALAAEAVGQPFDVVLMDMQMPVLDGYESTRQLRRRGYRRPIIALTAYALDEAGEECLRIGCDAFLGKPIDWGRLVRLIQKLTTEQTSRNHSSMPRAKAARDSF